jgi:hypothetical protein
MKKKHLYQLNVVFYEKNMYQHGPIILSATDRLKSIEGGETSLLLYYLIIITPLTSNKKGKTNLFSCLFLKFFLLQINILLVFLNYFDILILKIIFKK